MSIMSMHESLQPSEIPISGEELISIFGMRQVRNHITQVSREMLGDRQPTKWGLTIMRDLEKPYYRIISKSKPDPVRSFGEASFRSYKKALTEEQKIPIINIQFHRPDNDAVTPTLAPTAADLQALYYLEKDTQKVGYISSPISIIGVSKYREIARMLLVQAGPFTVEKFGIIDLLEQDLQQATSDQDAVKTVQDYGYKAGLISYRPDGLSPEDQLLLRSFAFTIQRK